MRAEKLAQPELAVAAALECVKREYLERTYNVTEWSDWDDFLEKVAKRFGKLLKGGEGDVRQAAVMVINDLQRGRLPYFIAPPFPEGEKPSVKDEEPITEKGEKEVELVNQIGKEKFEREIGGEQPLKDRESAEEDAALLA